MTKRSDLTEFQQREVIRLAHSWSREALATRSAHRGVAEAALDDIYSLAGYSAPKKRWMSSPVSAVVDAGDALDGSLAFELDSRLVIETRSIADKHGYDMSELLGDRLTRFVIPVGEVMADERLPLKRGQRRPPSWHIRRLNDLLDHRVNVITQLFQRSIYLQSVFLRGALDPFDLLALDVLTTVLDIAEASVLMPYSVLARSAGFVLPLEDRAWICERPTVMKRDRDGHLHASDGPALDWNGMTPFYMWHGEEVTRRAVGPVEDLRTWDISNEGNLHARDLMLERYGIERFILESGKRIQQDETGTLWRAGVIWAVEVQNGTPEPDGSFRKYFLRVPPTVSTAREGVAWSYGLRRRDYRVAMRT